MKGMSIRRQCGLTMLEVLVTLVITAFGLLGLVGFVTRSAAMTVEANQRARATTLLEDMEGRLRNNKTEAANYVNAVVTHGAAIRDCALEAAGADRDLCEWNNLLFGANDALTTNDGLTRQSFRGCITRPDALVPVFVITVAWGASMQATPPADTCAQDQFGDDGFRRIIRTQVRVATLAA
jgi:type IV pilus assembly protein PilV